MNSFIFAAPETWDQSQQQQQQQEMMNRNRINGFGCVFWYGMRYERSEH